MRKMISLLAAFLLLLSLCACKDKQEPRPVLAFVHNAQAGDYVTNLEAGFRNSADRLGYDCKAVKPENDSAEAQIALIEDLIKQGVRGIALNANQTEGLEDVLKKAQDAGIPVVTVAADTKGADLLVQPSTPELAGTSLMDAMLELANGKGKFVVISGVDAGMSLDPWVGGMEKAAQDSKYDKLVWAETIHGYGEGVSVDQMKTLVYDLMMEYPDLEVICCTGTDTLSACIQAVEQFGLGLRVTGLGESAAIDQYISVNRVCGFYFFWNPNEVGGCAAYALEALIGGATLQDNGVLTTQLGEYQVLAGTLADYYFVVGEPFCYGSNNRVEIEEEENEKIEQESTVFDIENIVWIDFFGYYGGGTPIEVPYEDMQEVIAWLNTFNIADEAEQPLPPGTNTYHVEIVYADGTIVKSGLDVVEVDGVAYNVTCDQMPDCVKELIEQSNLPE